MKGKGGIIGAIITLVIGGTIFTINKSDIVKNFSKDTGLTQQEAQQYVENISKDDLASFDKIGSDLISEGQDILKNTSEMDCINYSYKWETNTLSCEMGKSQMTMFGNDEIALGNSYKTLDTKSASKQDISGTISLIDKLNGDFNFDIVNSILDPQTIDDSKKTNSYNKALLQSTLESNK